MYEIRLQSYRQIIKIQQRNTVLSRSLEGKFIRHISSRVPSIWILNRQNSNDDLIEFFGLSKLSSIALKMAACIIWHPLSNNFKSQTASLDSKAKYRACGVDTESN